MKRIMSILLAFVMLSSALEAFAAVSYNDVTDEHWAAEYIEQLTDKGILFGTPEGNILPENNITRAEIAAMISRTYDEEYVNTLSFNDIQGHWAQKDIERLVDKGIILTDESGEEYMPDKYLTRIEMIRYVLRWLDLAGQAELETKSTSYVDDYMISESDKGYINTAKKYDIISGYPDNSVRPYGNITRGEVFKIFCIAWDIKTSGISATPEPTQNPSPSPTPRVIRGGGGGSSNRKAEVEFSIPDTAHTDTVIEFTTENKYVKSIEWILKRYSDEAQEYEPVSVDEYIDGTLTDKGGSFRIKTAGKYRICASASNSRGIKYEYSKDITVYDTTNVNIQIPEYTHTDTQINISANTDKEPADGAAKWNVLFEGKPIENIAEHIDGSLDGNDNTVILKKSGSYTFEYEITDTANRSFKDSKTITVYPVPELIFETSDTVHTDNVFPVAQKSDLSGYDVSWYLSKDNGDQKPYTEYTGFVLNENGGDIQLSDCGSYTLILSAVDTTGRSFEYSKNIKVMPVTKMSFTMQETAHTDTDVNITAEYVNIDAADTRWSVAKDGVEKEYTEYADGILNADGGSIRFKTDGDYTVTARFTDSAGREYTASRTIKVYKVPVLSYGDNALPEYAYTDSDILIKPDVQNLDSLNIEWYINDKPYSEYADGKLDNSGGTIRFKKKGHYTVTASITDETGREYRYDAKTDIYSVPQIGFEVPENTHTDINTEIKTNIIEADGLDIVWKISKDNGEFKELADGTIQNEGGTIRFKDKGSYILKASVTDSFGRVFEYSSEIIKVYPVPEVDFSADSGAEYPLPLYGYKDKNITVIPKVNELGSLKIQWLISKDGKAEKDYSAYVQGAMTNDGGNITFTNTGDYTLIAKVTDETGRVFTYSEDIMINATPEIDFTVPEYGYAGETVNISSDNSYKSEWTISKDSGKSEKYGKYADGTLTDKGGAVSFKDKGVYNITLTVTDRAGKTYSCTKKIRIIVPPLMRIEIPEYSYTDTEIAVVSENENMSNLNAEWYINDKPYQTYAAGTLANTGGTVRFSKSGAYSVKALVTDEYGKEYTFASEPITIYPSLTPSFEMPEYTYTNTNIDISNVSGTGIVWTINGKEYTKYAAGSLTDKGGSISFNKSGDYTLEAAVTDEKGRKFKYEKSISVYEVSRIELALSTNEAYTDEKVTIIADTENTDDISWYISKDGAQKQNYLKHAGGSLGNSGGELTFKETGIYTVYAIASDKTGRTYTEQAVITVTDAPEMELDIDKETVYIQETVRVSTRLSNIGDSEIAWYIEKNGEKKPYNDYVTGTLSNYGGNIYFSQGGEYTVYAVLTDRKGNKKEKSCNITIYGRPSISIDISETGYVGIGNKVITEVSGGDWDKIQWYISKNGAAKKNYLEYADGALTNDGGQITFNQTGTYILYAELTDKAGNTAITSESINIYNMPSADIIVPEITHTDTPVTVTAAFKNAPNSVSWYISKNNGSEVLYTNYCTGLLSKTGGQISFKSYGTYRLIARTTDAGGQKREFTTLVRVYPKPNLTTSLARNMHIDSSYGASYSVSKWGNQNIEWKLEKDGTPVNMTDYGTFNFSSGSISAAFNVLGSYELIAYIEDETEKVFRYAIPIEVYNTAPYVSGVSVNKTRRYSNGKYYTTLSPSAVDPDGDIIMGYEYQNKPSNDYYPIGTTYVKVRAKDRYGKFSDWYTVDVTISNSAPEAPTIYRDPDTISIAPGSSMTLTATSTDPDGDAVHFEWEGVTDDGTYPIGKHIIRCRAIDTAGLKSPATAVVFFAADEMSGGGMELVDAESRIVEEGIDGATISKYEFDVPAVDGHSGNDYGQVRGFNVHTGEWELIEKRDVSNGITMTGTLEQGKYSKLEFFYYASHCMYNKCNITYNVEFYFPAE